jgi:hypothetical protein
MARKAGVITINVQAGTAQMVLDMEKAKAKVREFGREGVSEAKATHAALKVLEGGFAGNSRAVAAFAEKVLDVGPAMQAIFPIIGGLAFGAMIFEVGKKVTEFFKHAAEGPERVAEAFRALNAPLRMTNDELRVANDRLENDIAKLEGHQQNTLKLALDEARVSADKLAESLEKDLSAMEKALRGEQSNFAVRWIQQFAGIKSANLAKAIGGETGHGGFAGRISEINDESTAEIAAAAAKGNADAQKEARSHWVSKLLAEYGRQLAWVEAEYAKTQPDLTQAKKPYYRAPTTPLGYVEELQGMRHSLRQEMSRIEIQTSNTDLTARKEQLAAASEATKKYQEAVTKLKAELASAQAAQLTGLERINTEEESELAKLREAGTLNKQTAALVSQVHDTKRVTELSKEVEAFSKSLDEQEIHWQRMWEQTHKGMETSFAEALKQGHQALEDRSKQVAKLSEEYNKLSAAISSQSAQHQVRMVGIQGRYSDPVAILEKQQAIERQIIEMQYLAALRAANTQVEQINASKQRTLELDRLDYEMEEKKAETRRRSIGSYIEEMRTAAKTIREVIGDAMISAMDGVSDALSRTLTGKRGNWAEMFRDLGQGMLRESIKSGLQRGIGAIGKAFGISGSVKRDGSTEQAALWVQLAGKAGGAPDRWLLSDLPGVGAAPASGGIFGKLLGSLIPHAEGGSVSPSSAYIVGERGPEILTGASGRIVSNATAQRMFGGGGDSHYYTIDARGTDPVLTEQRVYRAIKAAHDSAVSSAVQATIMRNQRVPAGRR